MVAQAPEEDDPDLLREMVASFAEQLMSAEADALCGAGYGSAAPSGSTRATATATGTDTRAGTVDLAVPKLREGSYTRAGCWSPAGGRKGPSPRSCASANGINQPLGSTCEAGRRAAAR